MKFIFFSYLLMILGGCALTAPNGEKVLMDDIQNDRERLKEKPSIFEGGPVFYKVRSYPRIIEGNIHGKHWILLQMKRERLDEYELMKSIEE